MMFRIPPPVCACLCCGLHRALAEFHQDLNHIFIALMHGGQWFWP